MHALKNQLLDDPTLMKTYKLLEHPVVTHTKVIKEYYSRNVQDKLGYLLSNFGEVYSIYRLFKHYSLKLTTGTAHEKESEEEKNEVQSVFIKAKYARGTLDFVLDTPTAVQFFAFTSFRTCR